MGGGIQNAGHARPGGWGAAASTQPPPPLEPRPVSTATQIHLQRSHRLHVELVLPSGARGDLQRRQRLTAELAGRGGGWGGVMYCRNPLKFMMDSQDSEGEMFEVVAGQR